MIVSLVLAWTLAARPAAAATLSAPVAQRLERLKERIAGSPIGRELLAESASVAYEQSSSGGAAVRYLRSPSAIAIDSRRLSALSEWDAELALVRELARAALDLPFEMPEGEMAAYRREIEYAFARAQADAAFGRALKQAYWKMGKRHEARRTVDLERPDRVGRWIEPPLPFAHGELERAGYFLYLFRRDRAEFCWAIEWGLPFGPSAVKWSELQDFMDLHRDELAGRKADPKAFYAQVQGRRYAPALVRAAELLQQSGERGRLAALFAAFDDQRAQDLAERIRLWAKWE